jgi:Na+-driven multidrug efflux pump
MAFSVLITAYAKRRLWHIYMRLTPALLKLSRLRSSTKCRLRTSAAYVIAFASVFTLLYGIFRASTAIRIPWYVTAVAVLLLGQFAIMMFMLGLWSDYHTEQLDIFVHEMRSSVARLENVISGRPRD